MRPKKKEERKNVNETLVPRGVLLHVMTLLSLVASKRERERERERERGLRGFFDDAVQRARAQKRAGGDVSETTNFDGFVCLFFCWCKGRRGVCVGRGQREVVVVVFFVTKDDDVFLERHKNTRDDFPLNKTTTTTTTTTLSLSSSKNRFLFLCRQSCFPKTSR